MLILTRRPGQSIVIDGRIVVTFIGRDTSARDRSIKIGISAPADVPVMRQELLGLEEQKPIDDQPEAGWKRCATCGKLLKDGRFLGTLHLCSE